MEPADLDQLSARLGQWRPPVRVSGGPVYVFPSVPTPIDPPPGARLISSSDHDHDDLAQACPVTWDQHEWTHLVAGELGPWVMAIQGGRGVSLCHTPLPLTGGVDVTGLKVMGNGSGPVFSEDKLAITNDLSVGFDTNQVSLAIDPNNS